MSKSERDPKNEKLDYVSLKEDFLGGRISFSEVKGRLFELDQATPMREASEENLPFLLDAQIVEFVAEHAEVFQEYHEILGLTELHIAQRLAGGGSPEALGHFEKALESMQKAGDDALAAYIEGVILYLNGKEISAEIMKRAESAGNVKILEVFNAGLEERGAPSYVEDSSKIES